MNKMFWVAAAALVGTLVGFACSPPVQPKCSVASCAGCCTSDGTCEQGTTAMACGRQGNSCTTCAAGQVCSVGLCTASMGGGSAGGSSAGGASGGGSTAGGSAGGRAGGSSGGGSSAGGNAGGGIVFTFDAGNPAPVTISFAPTCTTPTPCGGNVVGLWHYQDVCIEDGIFGNVQRACGGAAQTEILNRSGTARGAVYFDSTTMARAVIGSVDFGLTTTNPTCVNGFMGLGGCTQLPSAFQLAGVTGVPGTCALELPDGGPSPSTCTCRLTFAFNDQATDGYSTAANTISTDGGRTFDYCVQGSSMSYKETTPASIRNIARDPGISTLAKQ